MNDLITLVLDNLAKVGIGMGLFCAAYISNIFLGAWKSVQIDGYEFDGKAILQSAVKFVVLGLSIALLSCVVSIIPSYATYVGIEIGAETMGTINGLVIIGSFLTATIRYVVDAINKVKTILGG